MRRSARPTRSPAWAPWQAATSRTVSSSGRTVRSGWSGTASSSTKVCWPLCSASRTQVKEVAAGYECGLSIEKFNDIKEGDIIEAFTMEEIPQ